jgi:hypothetical protein
MKDDPDKLLKANDEKTDILLYPNEFMKIKDLYKNAYSLLKIQ